MADNRQSELAAALLDLRFEPGKSYLVFVNAAVVSREDLSAITIGGEFELTFILCAPGPSLLDAVRSIEPSPGAVVFVEEGLIHDSVQIPGVRIERVKASPHWALAEYRRAEAGWVPDHIPTVAIRGGHMRWDEETDRAYFERIVQSMHEHFAAVFTKMSAEDRGWDNRTLEEMMERINPRRQQE